KPSGHGEPSPSMETWKRHPGQCRLFVAGSPPKIGLFDNARAPKYDHRQLSLTLNLAGVQGMRWSLVALLAGPLAAILCSPHGQARDDKPPSKEAATKVAAFIDNVRPLLKAYCFECHNANKRKAGLDLEKIDGEAAALELVELW